MQDGTTKRSYAGCWTNLPALTQIERLESACHRVMLPAGGEEARTALRARLPLDLGASLNPLSFEASAVRASADQITSLVAILDQECPNPLVLRVAAARLCQTLANIRGHLRGGRRLYAASERSAH